MLSLQQSTHSPAHQNVPRHDVYAARCYILFTCIVAFTCSAWTLDNYIHGSTTMRAYGGIATVSSAMLVTGIAIEWLVHRNRGCCHHSADWVGEAMRKHGVGVSLVHVATTSIAIFSTCASAVNIFNNASAGLYTLSCLVLAVNWAWTVMCTPCTAAQLAVYSRLPEAQQRLLAFQQQATHYVWRNSQINPSLFT